MPRDFSDWEGSLKIRARPFGAPEDKIKNITEVHKRLIGVVKERMEEQQRKREEERRKEKERIEEQERTGESGD